jgi:hypothetical protein
LDSPVPYVNNPFAILILVKQWTKMASSEAFKYISVAFISIMAFKIPLAEDVSRRVLDSKDFDEKFEYILQQISHKINDKRHYRGGGKGTIYIPIDDAHSVSENAGFCGRIQRVLEDSGYLNVRITMRINEKPVEPVKRRNLCPFQTFVLNPKPLIKPLGFVVWLGLVIFPIMDLLCIGDVLSETKRYKEAKAVYDQGILNYKDRTIRIDYQLPMPLDKIPPPLYNE